MTCTCTREDHVTLKACLQEVRDLLVHRPEHYGPWFQDEREISWWASRRPWPGTTLEIGECACGSTVAICVQCSDLGEYEDVVISTAPEGPVVPCDCTSPYSEWSTDALALAAEHRGMP